jgi:hypothetical protein
MIMRKRLIDQDAKPFLYQAIGDYHVEAAKTHFGRSFRIGDLSAGDDIANTITTGLTVAVPDNPMVQLGGFHFGHDQAEFALERAMLLGELRRQLARNLRTGRTKRRSRRIPELRATTLGIRVVRRAPTINRDIYTTRPVGHSFSGINGSGHNHPLSAELGHPTHDRRSPGLELPAHLPHTVR